VIVSGGLDDADHVHWVLEHTGAAAVMLARGSLGNPWLFEQVLGTRAGDPSREEVLEEWQWVVEGLKEVAEFAQENDVVPGVEPLNRFETYLINRHDQAMQLADEVGHGLRVVLDAFHINIEEKDPIGAIKAVGSRMLDFHVADNNRRPAGQGKYNWSEVLSAMKESGYKGHLTAEFVLPLDRTPLAMSAEKHESDMDFTAADLKFIQDKGSGLISAAEYDQAVADNINHLKRLL